MTKKRQAQELINQIKQTKEQIVPKEECLQLIQKACMAEKTDADVQIDKITIKVSLKCQFDCQMI
jgi:HD-like signal output (HDOD) protein